jgi:vanillate/3-O-methylgallate O-demethylase
MAENRRSLQDLIDGCGNLVDYFYNDARSAHASARAGLSPVPQEVSNWREEQRAWRESVLLFDQSHHMGETFLKGPDAKRLLTHLGINSFENFPPLRARQYLACNHDGQIIGECVLQHLEEGSYELISGTYLQNWVQYNAEKGGYDVSLTRDPPTAENPNGRSLYRYQVDGPFAQAVFDAVVQGETPDIPLFRLARVKIAGCDVLALRHSMAGYKGVELSGPYGDGPRVEAALMVAGGKYGMRRAGLKTYFSTCGEVGWLGHPTPAIYSDQRLLDFRKWLPENCWEAHTELGGSFRSRNIEDYYFTPWELGFERLVKFDHDFIGRAALEKRAERGQHRRKVTLVWDSEDVTGIYASLMEPGLPYKYIELPKGSYAHHQYDEVRNTGGEFVGVSTYMAYTVNEGKFLSIAFVDAAHAAPGTQVILTWGEPDGGSRKPQVERHRQATIRATVGPVPYSETVRKQMRR